MGYNGVIAEPEWQRNRCLFCREKIGKIAEAKRTIKKVYRCPNCHRKIDERFIIH